MKTGNDSLWKIIGIEKGAKYAALSSFFDAKGNYKLSQNLEVAFKAIVPSNLKVLIFRPLVSIATKIRSYSLT